MLETILGETYGIMVYQEQVMQIAQIMAGYSLGGADLLRRAMGKKIAAEMDAQRDDLHARARPSAASTEAKADEIFDLMAKFAGYGFNKSHAAAYALVAYQTAWLKANHPVVFLAACMSLAISNTDKLAALQQEAERIGHRILPPDINRSGADFSVERLADGSLAIRYALAAVKKVGMAAMEAVVAARGASGRSPMPRISPPAVDPRQLNRMQIENLVARRGLRRAGRQPRAAVRRRRDDPAPRAGRTRREGRAARSACSAAPARPSRCACRPSPDWPPLERLASRRRRSAST